MRPILRCPHLRRGDVHRRQCRTGSRPGSGRLLALDRSHSAHGRIHHPHGRRGEGRRSDDRGRLRTLGKRSRRGQATHHGPQSTHPLRSLCLQGVHLRPSRPGHRILGRGSRPSLGGTARHVGPRPIRLQGCHGLPRSLRLQARRHGHGPQPAGTSGHARLRPGAPAHRLLDFSQPTRPQANAIVEIQHRAGLQGSPRTFADYEVEVHPERLPAGVELLVDGKSAEATPT
ncbi:hypothetical protein D779_1647 [Imhoffiella purpurea]|uniref:Uncharacterized protein n=1 Tax=Imhoffiella purpurea TaxID=1249627 RepID=W9V6A2_9GAMM|nr:hypothetical protein D779_1647 [Imhoffiella purpurea]